MNKLPQNLIQTEFLSCVLRKSKTYYSRVPKTRTVFLLLLFFYYLPIFHAEAITKNANYNSDAECFHTYVQSPVEKNTPENEETSNGFSYKPEDIRLKNKIIPLSNPVYKVLEYFETKGTTGFLPLAKPYRKIFIIELLQSLNMDESLSEREKKVIQQNLADLIKDSNSLEIYKQSSENTFVLVGVGAESSFRKGFGDNASWSTTNIIQPYFSGDLGENITFTSGIGGGIEQLSPDLFYHSYTKNGEVNFPNEKHGYSWAPYQFEYQTNYIHYRTGWSPPVEDELQIALFYNTEVNTSWLDGALELSFNNQHRSWGHKDKNLFLSESARRFPGFEIKIQPFPWFRYSYLVGSLFWLPAEQGQYRKSVYGEDLGRPQKMLSSQMVEILPFHWLKISGAGNGIWVKRFELAYLTPFLLPSLAQDNLGDTDNLSLYFDVAAQFRGFGKTWLGFYVDDFSFTDSWKMLKYVTNKYAWQIGWRTNLLSAIIPGTSSTLDFTRVTPFVYTHYPESEFSFSDERPIDMTYTHDGFNLGFYLPPNSGELSWSLVNIAIPNLILTLDNRLIIHGTNDLASENIYQIYGDIYHHHEGNINSYPMLDFTNDGIYDYSFQTEMKFDWKIRTKQTPHYYRLTGSIGYSETWWKSNESQVTAPNNKSLLTGSLGIIIEM